MLWKRRKQQRSKIQALQKRVSELESEVYALASLPAFLFDDPNLLWEAIWEDIDENDVRGYAVSSTLLIRLLKQAGFHA
jgi:hypothetical protein